MGFVLGFLDFHAGEGILSRSSWDWVGPFIPHWRTLGQTGADWGGRGRTGADGGGLGRTGPDWGGRGQTGQDGGPRTLICQKTHMTSGLVRSGRVFPAFGRGKPAFRTGCPCRVFKKRT